jgi:hypothetical protein
VNLFNSIREKILREVSVEVLLKKPNNDEELRDLVGSLIEKEMKK